MSTDTKSPVEGAKATIARLRDSSVRTRKETHGAVQSGFETLKEPYSDSEMKAYRGKHGRPVWDYEELRANEYQPEFKSFGDFLKGLSFDPSTEVGQHFQTRYNRGVNSIMRAVGLNTFEGDRGGSLVFPEFSTQILEREWKNDLYSKTTGYTVSGNQMTFPKAKDTNRTAGNRGGGVVSYMVGEEYAVPESRPSLGEVSLRLNEMCVAVFVTRDLLDDSGIALEQYISRVVRNEMNFRLGELIVRGTGTKQPQGYMNSPAKITVAEQSSQPADVRGQNILDMYERRIAGQDQSGYEWYVNQEVEQYLCKLELGSAEAAQLVYLPPGGLSQSPYATLIGKNVVPTEMQSAVGTEGDIAFCDLSQMISISKGGIVESMSPHVEFLRRQLCYLFTFRVDAKSIDDEPITPAYGTKTQSAFITLNTRTG